MRNCPDFALIAVEYYMKRVAVRGRVQLIKINLGLATLGHTKERMGGNYNGGKDHQKESKQGFTTNLTAEARDIKNMEMVSTRLKSRF